MNLAKRTVKIMCGMVLIPTTIYTIVFILLIIGACVRQVLINFSEFVSKTSGSELFATITTVGLCIFLVSVIAAFMMEKL